MRVLITGVTGFVGGHLAEALASRGGFALHGISRTSAWPAELTHLSGTMKLHAADYSDRAGLARLFGEILPDWILHLAAYAHVGRSFQEPDAAWAGNLELTRNVYEAVMHWGGSPRILYVSSGLVYGESDAEGSACDESIQLRPASPYAASKAAADLASGQYARHPGLDIVVVRPFNHIGPRQPPDYAVARFASQIAAIEVGRQPPVLETGDLSSSRDLSDVRDIVRAYVLLLEKGRRGEVYNAGSGTLWRMRDVLDQLLLLSSARVEVRSQVNDRPADGRAIKANAGKLRRETGWERSIPLVRTLQDTLEYWRRRSA